MPSARFAAPGRLTRFSRLSPRAVARRHTEGRRRPFREGVELLHEQVRPDAKEELADARLAALQAVYKVITKKTELDWGLTSDWKVEGPRKRAQRAAADEELVSPRRETPQPEASSKHGASEGAGFASSVRAPWPNEAGKREAAVNRVYFCRFTGYGEMTEGSIQRMLNTLKEIELAKIVNPVGTAPYVVDSTPRQPARFRRGGHARESTFCTAAAEEPVPSPRVPPHAEPPIKLTKAHRLSKNSTFIDVGSGYGKARCVGECRRSLCPVWPPLSRSIPAPPRSQVVLHAAADLPLKASVGIEMVESRHRLAAQVLQDLIAGRCKGCVTSHGGAPRDAARGAAVPRRRPEGRRSRAPKRARSTHRRIAAQKAQCLRVCSLKCGDATAERSLDFSHIYMYDYVRCQPLRPLLRPPDAV